MTINKIQTLPQADKPKGRQLEVRNFLLYENLSGGAARRAVAEIDTVVKVGQGGFPWHELA